MLRAVQACFFLTLALWCLQLIIPAAEGKATEDHEDPSPAAAWAWLESPNAGWSLGLAGHLAASQGAQAAERFYWGRTVTCRADPHGQDRVQGRGHSGCRAAPSQSFKLGKHADVH